jgi:hypothetical protein
MAPILPVLGSTTMAVGIRVVSTDDAHALADLLSREP